MHLCDSIVNLDLKAKEKLRKICVCNLGEREGEGVKLFSV